jgi:hypothetical protein
VVWHRPASSVSRQANKAGAGHAVQTQQPGWASAAGAESDSTAAIATQITDVRRRTIAIAASCFVQHSIQDHSSARAAAAVANHIGVEGVQCETEGSTRGLCARTS